MLPARIPCHFSRFLLLLFLFIANVVYANNDNNSKNEIRLFSDIENLSFPSSEQPSFSTNKTPPADSTLRLIEKINSLAEKVEVQGRLIDKLDPNYEARYPLGIAKNIGGLNYIIVLENDEITTQGAFINAYMSFIIPQSGKRICFAAQKVPLSASGGINGIVELVLVDNEIINLGSFMQLVLYGRDNKEKVEPTKVRFDCSGFIDMTISAGIEFSTSIFVAEDKETGKQLPDKDMTVRFNTVIQSWNDLIVQVDLPPFQLKPLKGFGFEVQQATFDMSDISNPAGIVFPKDYPGLLVYGDFPHLWQGLYLRQAALRLPEKLNNGTRIQILAQNLILDDMGLTGIFAAENLLPIDKGNIGGWSFSIDRFEFSLLANSLVNAGLSGKLNMPVMDSTDYMNYDALIDQKGDFIFTASMPKSFNFNLFAATMSIYETSAITIQEVNEKFTVSALLNGEISVNAPLSQQSSKDTEKKGFVVNGLRFENMLVTSSHPYFSPGIWSLADIGVHNLKGFSLYFSDISGFEENNDVGLRFTFNVSLGSENSNYSASTTLKIIGTRYTQTTDGQLIKHKLKYKRTVLEDLYISVKDKPISLVGFLTIFDNDKTFGDGFAGMISATICNNIGVQVKAVFGKKDDFKYWYADAFANFSSAPVLIFTGIFMKGIGGGAYYHMKQANFEKINISSSNNDASNSRVSYIPDKAIGLGFKASIGIGTNPGNGFNAVVTFEIVFNSNGGINSAMFYGTGVLMEKINFADPLATDAPVKADVYIGLDFENKTFHGSFKVYVNAAHGMITGINPGNLAGEMVIHADPSDWYIHIGKPSARVGLKLKVFGLTIENGSYFMMGTKIEEMPLPPEQVLRLLQLPLPENRNNAELMSAKGFAFGTYFHISTGTQKFLIFYGSFEMGIGFDVMLSDKEETYCVETGEKIGINGWYAEGQCYAFVESDIGIDIKVFKIKVHQEILSFGAAILLEAKLPNPIWMRGTVGGYYSILGGRVKGNCRFQLELGNQCTVISMQQQAENPVEGLDAIAEFSPGDGRTSVDVFTTPQVVFNYQIGRQFRISDDLNDKAYYKIVLDEFKVTAGNNPISGSYQWNNESDVLVFTPNDILPGETEIKLEAKVHFENIVNGKWATVKLDNGEPATEIKTAVFRTGQEPDYIPESNVLQSYPMKDMMNLYKNEFSDGHVKLKFGQNRLFQLDNAKWRQYGRYTPVAGGEPIYVNFTYDSLERIIRYPIDGRIQNNTIYRFELVNIPAEASSAIDANIKQITTTVTQGGAEMEIKSKTAESTRSNYQEKVIYTCYFRTSIFNTLQDKINAITDYYTISKSVGLSPLVFNLISLVIIPEPFDKYELSGHNNIQPLLKLWASKEGVWLKNRQIPFIYADYPIIPEAVIRNRDTAQLGFIPVRNVNFNTYNEPKLLNDQEKVSGITDFLQIRTYFNYDLSPVTFRDYSDIAAALSLKADYTSPRKTEILTQRYPSIIYNITYPVYVQYKLPFADNPGTTGILNIAYE